LLIAASLASGLELDRALANDFGHALALLPLAPALAA